MSNMDDLITEWRRRAAGLHHSCYCHVKTKASVRQRAHAMSEVYLAVAEELEDAITPPKEDA